MRVQVEGKVVEMVRYGGKYVKLLALYAHKASILDGVGRRAIRKDVSPSLLVYNGKMLSEYQEAGSVVILSDHGKPNLEARV